MANRKKYMRIWRKKNPEKLKQYVLNNSDWRGKYRKDNKDRLRECELKHKYGITIKEYNDLFKKQDGMCVICGTHQSELRKRLGVDHNHTTGVIRGLLCDDCNVGLGLFKDSSELTNNATKYLEGQK